MDFFKSALPPSVKSEYGACNTIAAMSDESASIAAKDDFGECFGAAVASY